jgi:hypothetical protein
MHATIIAEWILRIPELLKNTASAAHNNYKIYFKEKETPVLLPN